MIQKYAFEQADHPAKYLHNGDFFFHQVIWQMNEFVKCMFCEKLRPLGFVIKMW